MILDILPESVSVNLGINANKILDDLHISHSTYFYRDISKKII